MRYDVLVLLVGSQEQMSGCAVVMGHMCDGYLLLGTSDHIARHR